MPILTLTTDFGLVDHYVAAMKGAMLSLAPGLTFVDVSHDVPPQDVLIAAHLLRQTVPYFPVGTVHLVVVDPGVGTERAGLIVENDSGHRFVGPDNGVLSLCLDGRPPKTIHQIDADAVAARHGRPVSATFHGRDVFGPVAALLATGTSAADLGCPVEAMVTLGWAQPLVARNRLVGHVLHLDRYGNLISNIDRATFEQFAQSHPNAAIWVGRTKVGMPQRTYGSVEEGDPVALFGSGDLLEIAVHHGQASDYFNARRGTEIWVDGGA